MITATVRNTDGEMLETGVWVRRFGCGWRVLECTPAMITLRMEV